MNKHDLAKIVQEVGGHLQWLKKPTRMYKLKGDDPGEGGFEFEPAGWRMHPWVSIWAMGIAMKLSGWHWDHWALEHTDCDPRPCPVCGGGVCADDTIEQL